MIALNSVSDSFRGRGFKESEYFRHQVVLLQKKYPDSVLVMEKRGFSREEIQQGMFFQINVYADEIESYPVELFFDRQINWHGQQWGRKGLIGSAGLYISDSRNAFVTIIQSDLVQQIFRSKSFRKYKSRIENQFRDWARITFNALVHSANLLGVKNLFVPDSATIVSLLNREVDPRIYVSIYDTPVNKFSKIGVSHKNLRYWSLKPNAIASSIGEYEVSNCPPESDGKAEVCILHDIEQNVDSKTPISACKKNLELMLAIESEYHVQGTYNILGKLFPSVAPGVLEKGHTIGFHSWNHDSRDGRQLAQVREVDLQIKGYRPPRSKMTDELSAYNLSYWNFEWLACSRWGLDRLDCFIDQGVAHIPIDIDDYDLYLGRMSYQQWRDHVLTGIQGGGIYVFSLHDCYANVWINQYGELLSTISEIANFKTCEDIAGGMFMNTEVWEKVHGSNTRYFATG